MIRKPFGLHTGSVVLTWLVLFGFGCVPECLAVMFHLLCLGPRLGQTQSVRCCLQGSLGVTLELCQPEFQCSDTEHKRDRGA